MQEIGIIANSYEIFENAQKVAKDYADRVTIVLVQNYEECVQHAKRMEAKGVRILISRGGHCVRMRESDISLPVIEIPTFDNQLAYRMTQAKKQYGAFAAIGSKDFLERVRAFEDVVESNIHYFEVGEWADFSRHTETAKKMGLCAVVGGYDASRFAQNAGLESFCTFTREKEISTAFYEALKMLKRMDEDKNHTQMLRTMLNSIHEGIVLVDKSGSVTHINKLAQKMLGTDNRFSTGISLQKYSIQQKVQTVLQSGVLIEDELIETPYCKYTCTIHPIKRDDIVDCAVVVLQEVDYVHHMEYKIRHKLTFRGFVANRTFDDIIGESAAIQEAIRKAKQYSVVDSNILIYGESGTGKEVFAQSIHHFSLREKETFVAINCATLPPNLLESELFGYVDGAFTGAKKGGKVGLFELAHNGTIFLDEIGETSLPTQARLLRVIEEKQIMRLGDDRVIPVNIRIIAATNKNLRQMMEEGNFRQDLFYRLDVLSLCLPPLRERREDIPLLAGQFVKSLSEKYGRVPVGVEPEGMDVLKAYHWPGNIRELKNVIERLVVMLQGDHAGYGEIVDAFSGILPHSGEPPQGERSKDDGLLEQKERELIEKILEEAGGNKSETARRLGISRMTLHRKLKDIGEAK